MENEISERKITKEIAILETEGVKLEVTISPEQDTVWLSRVQMAELFNRDIKTIGKHIANARHEELKGQVVVAKFATTTQHGAIQGKTQTHKTEYYNLDVIISVGYRVKSNRGVELQHRKHLSVFQWFGTLSYFGGESGESSLFYYQKP